MSNMIYSNGSYFVIRTVSPKHRPFKVVSCNYKLHTHVRNKKEAIDLANYAKHEKIPRNASIDYLVSFSRLVIDNEGLLEKVENLIEVKKNKKEKYINRR